MGKKDSRKKTENTNDISVSPEENSALENKGPQLPLKHNYKCGPCPLRTSTQKEKAANDQAALPGMWEEVRTLLGERGTALSKCRPGKFPIYQFLSWVVYQSRLITAFPSIQHS